MKPSALRICVVIPTYDNPETVQGVVERTRQYIPDVLVVDDGSSSPGRAACENIARLSLANVYHREKNGGKGAAIKDGFRLARDAGYTHVLQVDADGQHDLSAIPRFVELCRAHPGALILGCPSYDATAPRMRMSARKITKFWVDLEIGRGVVSDAMIGFRIYPLGPLSPVRVRGDRMSFDIEVCVRAAWAGIPIFNEPVAVRYLSQLEGGISHFRPWRDNLHFFGMHARLTTWRMFTKLLGLRPGLPAGPALELPPSGAGSSSTASPVPGALR